MAAQDEAKKLELSATSALVLEGLTKAFNVRSNTAEDNIADFWQAFVLGQILRGHFQEKIKSLTYLLGDPDYAPGAAREEFSNRLRRELEILQDYGRRAGLDQADSDGQHPDKQAAAKAIAQGHQSGRQEAGE